MFENQLFVVGGNPVLHSKSPILFNRWFPENNSDCFYSRISAVNAEELISFFKNIELGGLNITSPFKEDIIPYLDTIDEVSKRIGAVNTVINKNGQLAGYNTDCSGCIMSLKKIEPNLKNKKCIILGAGGAARASVYGMITEGAEVIICNRTYSKAKSLAIEFGCKSTRLNRIKEQALKADIIISTVNFDGIEEYFTNLKPGIIILDAVYHNSRLRHFNKNKAIIYLSGEDWLINQGLESYRIFTGNDFQNESNNKSIIKQKLFKSNDNIILIGFTGSGKTTLGKILAKKLNYKFIDTDAIIVAEENMKIKKIFKLKGEKYFRKKEAEVLKKLKFVKNCVISTGGDIIKESSNKK